MKGVNHLFAKSIILYCVLIATLASAYALVKQGEGMSMEGVLGITLGFFGGELLMLCAKTIFKKERKNESFDDEQNL